MHKMKPLQQISTQIILACVGLFVLLPILGMLRLALDGTIKSVPTEFRIIPEQITLDAFQHVWEKPSQTLTIPGLLKNSLIAAGGAALFSILLGGMMAYAFARFRFPGRRSGLFALLIGALLPPVALMTPLYIVLSEIGLRTSLSGLIIVYTAFAMPFCVWNLRTSFQTIPVEIEEAAFLDGATPLISFWRIMLPLIIPALIITGVVAFLIGYTEFAIGWLFVEKSANVTLAMAVSGMMTQASTSWNNLSAISILMSIPVILIFLLLQRLLLLGQIAGTADG
jgi:ABC-type glycerol-3-phosphate transport system permease component